MFASAIAMFVNKSNLPLQKFIARGKPCVSEDKKCLCGIQRFNPFIPNCIVEFSQLKPILFRDTV